MQSMYILQSYSSYFSSNLSILQMEYNMNDRFVKYDRLVAGKLAFYAEDPKCFVQSSTI